MEKYLVPLQTPCVYYDADFLSADEAAAAYADLLKNTAWETSPKINRWVSLCHELSEDNNTGADYKYRDAPSSGTAVTGCFTDTIRRLGQRAEQWYFERSGGRRAVHFNVCLLNFYENGLNRIGWHADREELGRDTPIASISLGAVRQFLIRAKVNGMQDRASLFLQSGSLVVMENICQFNYLHSVPKEVNVMEGRINLTFRCKSEGTAGEEMHARRDTWLDSMVDGVVATETGWSNDPITSSSSSARRSSSTAAGHQGVVFGHGVVSGVDVDATRIRYLAKTNLSAEGYCAAEIQELLLLDDDDHHPWTVVARPCGMDGYVACVGGDGEEDSSATVSKLLKLRSAHHVLQYHTHFDLSDCVTDEFPTPELVNGEALYRYFKQRLVAGTVSVSTLADLQQGSFRVTCERIGVQHALRSPEVEREIGGALSEFYTNCIPKMEDYDIHVRADVVGNLVVVGTQLNVHDLSKERHFLKFRNAVTIKTNLAYAMVRCANIQPGARIADPFCGSGTLLLEALDVYDKQLTCVGLDVSKRSVEGSRKNALAENCGSDICEFICSDARGLRRHLADDSVDAIMTNLPWGVMTGHKDVSDLQTMYEIFLRNSWYVLKDGARIVMLVLRGLQLTRIIRKLSGRYRLLSVNVVRTTNNLPCIIVIEKLAVDELRESVKGQLAHLNKFVSVSPEIYEAIHMETIDES